jgi:hypothetical protein
MNTSPEKQRGPGRPRKEEQRRRRKTTVETGGRLGVNPAILNFDDFAYRWVNDTPARIANMTKNDDWDLVFEEGAKEDNTDLGSAVSVVVGSNPDGSPRRAYLCRKPKTYYDEDKAAEQTALDEQLEQLRRGNTREGEAQSDYIPKSGIRIG